MKLNRLIKICIVFLFLLYFLLCCGNKTTGNYNLAADSFHYTTTSLEKQILDLIKTGDLAQIKKIIRENNFDIEKINSSRDYNWLMAACKAGNLEMVVYFISMGIDINAENTVIYHDMDGFFTALYYAIESNSYKIIKLLLDKGAVIKSVWDNYIWGSCPELAAAVKNGNIKIVKLLMKSGADIQKEDTGPRLVSAALDLKKLDMALFLKNSNALKNAEKYDLNVIMVRAASLGSIDLVSTCLDMGADIREDERLHSGEDEESATTLGAASAYGQLKLVKYLVENNIITDKKMYQDDGVLPAAKNGHLEIIKYLVGRGAKTDHYMRQAPLMAAVRHKNHDIITYLVETKKVDVNEIWCRSISNQKVCDSAVANAIEIDSLDLVKYFIAHGANMAGPNSADRKVSETAYNAIGAACKFGRTEILNYLIDRYRMDFGSGNYASRAMAYIFLAIENNHADIVKILIAHNINKNKDWYETNPIVHAAKIWKNEIVKILLQEGEDPLRPDENGESALGLAYAYKDQDLINTILAYGPEHFSVDVFSVSASSFFTQNDRADVPENCLDKNPQTAWIEGRTGIGRGDFITLAFKQKIPINAIEIHNADTHAGVSANNIKTAKIVYRDSHDRRRRSKILEFKNNTTARAKLGETIVTNYLKLYIFDVFGHSEYSGIAELAFYLNDKKYVCHYKKEEVKKTRGSGRYTNYPPLDGKFREATPAKDEYPGKIETLFESKKNGVKTWGKAFPWTYTELNKILKTGSRLFMIYGHTDIGLLETDSNLSSVKYRVYRAGNEFGVTTTKRIGDAVFVAGYYGNPDGGNAHCDALIVKFDNTFKPILSKIFGGGFHDYAVNIHKCSDNSILVSGNTKSFGFGKTDYWALKLDQDFHCIWQKTYGGQDEDILTASTEDDDGNILLAGYSKSFNKHSYDFWLLKIDTDGNILWQKTFGTKYDDELTFCTRAGNHDFILTGFSKVDIMNRQPFICKIDDTGNLIEADAFTAIDSLEKVFHTLDNKLLLTGTSGNSMCLLKMDDDMHIIWARKVNISPDSPDENPRYEKVDRESINDIVFLNDQSFIGAGRMMITISSRNTMGTKERQFILRFLPDGTLGKRSFFENMDTTKQHLGLNIHTTAVYPVDNREYF